MMEFKTSVKCFPLFDCFVIICIMFSYIFTKTNGSSANTTPRHFATQYVKTAGQFTSTTGENDIILIGSEYCKGKSSCSSTFFQTFPDKNCHCDTLCKVLDDCCVNYSHEMQIKLKKKQFSCVSLKEIVKHPDYGVTMVTKCSDDWTHGATKRLCEEELPSDDIFLRLPVSDESSFKVMYRNMYCAQCNFEYAFQYWKLQKLCVNETGVWTIPEMDDCDWIYLRPRPEIEHRICQLQPPVINTCTNTNELNRAVISEQCRNGEYNIVFDASGKSYRNLACAECNKIDTAVYCEQIHPLTSASTQTLVPKKVYSFRLLVDFNKATATTNGVISDLPICSENEKYDSFSQKCREIFCAPGSVAVNGSCELTSFHRGGGRKNSCSVVKLDPTEYRLENNSRLFLFSDNKSYTDEEFQTVGSDVFICLNITEECLADCSSSSKLFPNDIVESYLTLTGLIISIISLAITFTVYVMFPPLLNIPGKILVCLMASLGLAQLLFIVSAQFESMSKVCTSVAVLVHYFYIAAFRWMNAFAFDMWMTFSNRYVIRGSNRKQKRFLKYNLYGWATPALIVCCAVILDFVKVDDRYKSLKPGYGTGVCWISSKDALILFFAGPLALLKFFDIVSFVFTAVHIARAKRQGAMATQKSTCSFFINLKLSLIMGLTWVFAFVANFWNEPSMWYLFIIFNSLQGLFIAICFLCTKKVGRLLLNKFETFSTKSHSGTQLSFLSKNT